MIESGSKEQKQKYAQIEESKFDLLARYGNKNLPKKADSFVESLFYTYEKGPEKDEKASSTNELQLDSSTDLKTLQFSNLSESRKLVFDDKDSLAMESLKTG